MSRQTPYDQQQCKVSYHSELVNKDDGLPRLRPDRCFRILVAIAGHGIAPSFNLTALLVAIPHRVAVGLICDVGAETSSWSSVAQSRGYDLVAYEPSEPDLTHAQVNGVELCLGIIHRLHRDRKIDTVLVIGTLIPRAVAREIRDAGAELMLAVRAGDLFRALAITDVVVNLDVVPATSSSEAA